MRLLPALPALFLAALPQPALAQVAAADSGDTGWMLVCSVLLLIAALPGVMLRHAGLANVRNALSVMTQGIAMIAIVSLGWGIAGYSLIYAPGGGWIGGTANLMLANLAALRDGLTVPESAFVVFQMAAALIAASLLAGAVAERTRLAWFMGFAPLWLLIVYVPITHAIWAGGWLAQLGVMDFAGSLVVHATGGWSALALTLIVGARRQAPIAGHSPVLALAGGALLWIGLSGLIGGWALGATDDAATALLNHHFAACAGALLWMATDRLLGARNSAMGVLSGALAGIAAIAGSAALVGSGGAMLIGGAAALLARLGLALTRRWIDDPAQIFVIHGIGGLIGALLLPLGVLPLLGGVGFEAGIGLTDAIIGQLVGIIVVAFWAMAGSAIAALAISVIIPMRVTEQVEHDGLDVMYHGEQSWDFR